MCFLKRNRLAVGVVALGIISGCVTMGFVGVSPSDTQKMTTLKSWSPESYRKAADDMYKASKDKAVIDDAKNLFCKNGKQIRKLSVRIDSILPKLPAGIPMDRASTFTKIQMDQRRKDVRRFFEIASRRGWDTLTPDTKCGVSYHPKNNTEPFGVGDEIGIIPDKKAFRAMATKPDNAKTMGFVNTQRFPYEFPSWALSGTSEPRADVVYQPVKPIFVAFDKEPILMVGNVFNYYKPMRSARGLSGCELVNSKEKEHTQPREGFVFASEPTKTINITRLEEGLSVDAMEYLSQAELKKRTYTSELKKASSVSNAIIMELAVLRKNYTMAIPHAAQVKFFCSDSNRGNSNKLFGLTYGNNVRYQISCTDRGVKDDAEDGWKIDVANAISDKDKLWSQYLESMTSLKESPSKEPNTMSYSATLDLGVFCQYGRKLDELVTQ